MSQQQQRTCFFAYAVLLAAAARSRQPAARCAAAGVLQPAQYLTASNAETPNAQPPRGGYTQAAFFMVGSPAALLCGYLTDKVNRIYLLIAIVVVGHGPCLCTYWVGGSAAGGGDGAKHTQRTVLVAAGTLQTLISLSRQITLPLVTLPSGRAFGSLSDCAC